MPTYQPADIYDFYIQAYITRFIAVKKPDNLIHT